MIKQKFETSISFEYNDIRANKRAAFSKSNKNNPLDILELNEVYQKKAKRLTWKNDSCAIEIIKSIIKKVVWEQYFCDKKNLTQLTATPYCKFCRHLHPKTNLWPGNNAILLSYKSCKK